MRTAFIEELLRQARVNPRLFLVVGDLGYSVVESFAREFPDRFLNAGVAEQNMTGMAAGLASEGYHVFTYSIANFPTLRCLEQIRNDIAYHGLPVTIVSVGAGVAYGNLGYSHHAVQDLGILRTFEELTIVSPADPGETCAGVEWLVQNPSPSYLRLGKAGEPNLHAVKDFSAGPLRVVDGTGDVALVCTGSILKVALEVSAEFAKEGNPIPVFSCPLLQPLGREYLNCLLRFKALHVLEEHLAVGGLASSLRESLQERVAITSHSLQLKHLQNVGSQEYLRARSGLDVCSIAEALKREMR